MQFKNIKCHSLCKLHHGQDDAESLSQYKLLLYMKIEK